MQTVKISKRTAKSKAELDANTELKDQISEITWDRFPVVLLGAIIAGELAFTIFLGVVFIVELIMASWLGLKLTNKYFIYTTYNKLSYNPRREQIEAENRQNKNNIN